jgi:hypothetical protein
MSDTSKENDTGDTWVEVSVVNGEIEAQQIRAFFEANGILCRFKGESLRKTHGLTLDGLGKVSIRVPEDVSERARELLAQVESGALELPADVDVEEGPPPK